MKQFYLIILLSLFITTIKAQWTSLPEPRGGNCYAFARVGTEIWAGYYNGIYTSANEGITWSKHPTLKSPTLGITVKGDTIMLLIQQNPAFYQYYLSSTTSFDGGITWSTPAIAVTDSYVLTSEMRGLFLTGSSLVLQTSGSEHFYSNDYGLSWDTIAFPGTYRYITAHSKNYLVCYQPLPPNKGNYYSADGGATWNFLDSAYVLPDAYIIDSTFYFEGYHLDSTYHYFIARTSDFGVTYDTLAYDLLGSTGSFGNFNEKLYYSYWPYPQPVISYESADGGDTWTPSNLPEIFYYADNEYAIQLANWEWLMNMDGMYRYNPSGNTYYLTETGINARSIEFIFQNKGVLFAGGDAKLEISANGGSTWIQAPEFVDPRSGIIFKGDTVLTRSRSAFNTSNLAFSYDNGITWDSLQTAPDHFSPLHMIKFNDKLFATNYNYTSVSNDWGITWDSLSTFEDSVCFVSGMYGHQFAICNNELYHVDKNQDKVSKFDSLTQTWKLSFCVPLTGVSELELKALDNYITVGGSYKFFVSVDSGNTWYAPQRTGLPMYGTSIFAPENLTSIDGVWFCTSAGNDIYYSLDHGENWQIFPTDPDMSVYGSRIADALIELNGVLYAGGIGVWKNTAPLEIITGKVYFDDNNNGVMDGSEIGLPNALLTSSPIPVSFTADTNGDYVFLSVASGDSLIPALPTNFCSASPSYYLSNGPASNIDFGIYFYPNILDNTIDFTNRSIFRPGFTTIMDVTIKNLGTVDTVCQVEIVLDSILTFLNASITPDQVSGNTITFTTDTLTLFDEFHFTLDVETHSTAITGDSVFCFATVYPVNGDTVPADNVSLISEMVTGSFDPNDKTCLTGDYFTPAQVAAGDNMKYIIRFQNVGNFQADNIHIIDTLSQYFNISTFQVYSSSHPMHYSINGNGIVTFYFDNILLPAMSINEPASHGFVKYGIECYETVSLGTGITNNAYIYFDFNSPVETNTTATLIAEPPVNVGITETNDKNLIVYPNPANDILHGMIDAPSYENYTIKIYNTLGQIQQTITTSGNAFKLDVSNLPAAIYFGDVVLADSGNKIHFRFVINR